MTASTGGEAVSCGFAGKRPAAHAAWGPYRVGRPATHVQYALHGALAEASLGHCQAVRWLG